MSARRSASRRSSGGVRRPRSRRLRRASAAALLSALLLALACPLLDAAAVAEEPGQGLELVGTQLLKDGEPFLPRGFNLVGALAPDWCTKGQGVIARTHLDQAEMDAAKQWHANTVRLQVSQRGLADPAISQADRDAYLQRIADAVALARSNGFVVDLSVQDQYNGCGLVRPLPSAQTSAAWSVLAPRFSDDPYVMFELYNEPNQENTAEGWAQWKYGGTSPNANLGEAAVGHQLLVQQLRDSGASNIIIADGLNKAERLSGLPLLEDPLGRLMYGIHPYYYSRGSTWWDQQYGYLTASQPVIATEWNYLDTGCGGANETLAPQLLEYLQSHRIGLLAHALDVPGNTVADWQYNPTACGGTVGGSGAVTLDYFAGQEAQEQGTTDPPSPELPAVPAALAVTMTPAGQAQLSWLPGEGGTTAAGYRIYRDGTVLGDTGASPYTDGGVTQGTTYVYAVAALDASGRTSDLSAEVTVTVPDTSAPTVPTAVKAALVGGAPQVTWTPSTDNVAVAGYVVLRDGAVVGQPTSPSFLDTGASQGTSHTYTVRARDAAGNVSAPSPGASIGVPDTTAPSAPGTLKAVRSRTSAALSWKAATDNVRVAGYVVYRGTTVVARPGATTLAFTVTGLRAATKYTFSVRARDAAGNLGPAVSVVA